MRHARLSLLFVASLLFTSVHAEETAAPAIASPAETSADQAQLDALEQRLAESERLRGELNAQLQGSLEERENAQLQRLRQDNQRLKLQLREAQASQQAPLLSEAQMWFAIGAAVTVFAVLCGALLRGSRKARREWIN